MADPRSQRRVTGLMSHIFPRAAGVASVFSDARSEKTTVAETVVETPEKLSLRAKARVSGLNGNYWFAFEQIDKLKPAHAVQAIYWGTPICLWRSKEGDVFAIHDQCPGNTPLSKGLVDGGYIECSCPAKHRYNSHGQLVNKAQQSNGRYQPSRVEDRLRTYPTEVRYKLIFVFPGDPTLAHEVPLPTIPWLDQKDPVPFRMADFTMESHWSLIIENNCDFYHAYLHRKYKPFTWPELQWVQREGDAIQVHYKTDMGGGQLAQRFTPKNDSLKNMHLWFDYPYQRSNLVDQYLHWCFVLPMGPQTTRSFYVFLWGPITVGGMQLPRSLRPALLYLAHKFYLVPLLSQDRGALEEEQSRTYMHLDKHAVELNPLVSAFQKMAVEKWEQYLEREKARKASVSAEEWRLTRPAGVDV